MRTLARGPQRSGVGGGGGGGGEETGGVGCDIAGSFESAQARALARMPTLLQLLMMSQGRRRKIFYVADVQLLILAVAVAALVARLPLARLRSDTDLGRL